MNSFATGARRGSTPIARMAASREIAGPSAWCTSRGKRIFDAVAAALLLVPAFPFMAIAAVLVKTSSGPIFYGCERAGQGGKPIRVWKFRTMRPATKQGLQLTRAGDNRVTPAGRFLRKWKLDELPQLVNVVTGDMSLIGPRPDSAEYLNALRAEHRAVLALKPGIASVASLRFRNEEEFLSGVAKDELEGYYVQNLLPEKIRLDFEYAHHASFFTDLKLLLKTAVAILR